MFIHALGPNPQKNCSESLPCSFLKVYNAIDDSCLNKLATATKGTKQFSNSQALSSGLAVLGMLQP